MKKLTTCLFVSIFLSPLPNLCAQNTKYLKLGLNRSSFRNEQGKSEHGLTFGFGKNYFPSKSSNGFWGFEFGYIRKKVTVEDRTWPTDFFYQFSDVVLGNITADIAYFEALGKIGYKLDLKTDWMILYFATGFFISVPIKNHTDGIEKEIIFLEPDEKGKFDFDYFRSDEKRNSSPVGLRYSVILVVKQVSCGFAYTRALTATEGFTVQSISDKMDSIQLTLAYSF